MPHYDVEWAAQGIATVYADDPDEAEALVKESIENFETVQLEAVDVTGFETTGTSECGDGDE